MKKVQLYSGGLDSYIISKLWKPDVKLYFNYGTKQNELEMKHLPSDVVIKDLPIGEYMEEDGLHTIPLRNLIFSALAINYGDEVCIGGLKSDLHYDKKPKFVRRTTKLFNSVLQKERSARTVKVVVPFSHMTKTELLIEFFKQGGTEQELNDNSWSCYEPTEEDKPCGKCKACRAREQAIKEAKEKMKCIE